MPDKEPIKPPSEPVVKPVEVTNNFNQILSLLMLIVAWVAIFLFIQIADKATIEAFGIASASCGALFGMYIKIFGTALFKSNSQPVSR